MTRHESLIQRLTHDLYRFTHPSINPTLTQILAYDDGPTGTLDVRLYDPSGRCVIEDRPLKGDLTFPGMFFSVYPRMRTIHIETCYIHPAYQGRKLGTDFIHKLMEASKRAGVHEITLHPDEKTEAQTYWSRIHGFIPVDPRDSHTMRKLLL